MLQTSERQQQDGIHLDKHTTHVLVTWAPTYTTSSRGGKILPLKKLLSSPSTSQFGFRVANRAHYLIAAAQGDSQNVKAGGETSRPSGTATQAWRS